MLQNTPLQSRGQMLPMAWSLQKTRIIQSLKFSMKSARRWLLAHSIIRCQSLVSQQDHHPYKRRKWLSWGCTVIWIWTRTQLSSTCWSIAPVMPPTTITHNSPSLIFTGLSTAHCAERLFPLGLSLLVRHHHRQCPVFFLFCLGDLIPFEYSQSIKPILQPWIKASGSFYWWDYLVVLPHL